MEFRLLGSVEARTGDQVVGLGPRQQRLVMAVLAWEANRLVPIDRLVGLVWPEDPPRTAQHAIRVCVSHLRSLLFEVGESVAEVTVMTRGPGYVLRIDPMRIDVHRFHALVDQARAETDDNRKVARLDQALGLWAGPALADIAAAQTRDRLCRGAEEARLVAVEDRLDALLRLGRHNDVVGELTTLVDGHPSRERLVGQLMLALYRGGRASGALEVYRRTRTHLSEELGIDPGSELQQLELDILRNDPDVHPPQASAVGARLVPALVPPAIADFTGRAHHLDLLDAADASAAVVISAIAGTAGVGKTALAVHWAHRVRDRFPDGQLYVNLRGYASDPPLPSAQALFQFLRAVGVPPEQVPLDAAEATGMYRTVLAGKRMLVLLDNAFSAEQVRPLLPASPGCRVVITSRDRLDGLVAFDGARRITLGVLPLDEAVALLAQMLGVDRIAAEPDAAAELARTCSCLPLALRIAAAHLANHPGRPIAERVAELRRGDLLADLEVDGDEQTAVRAAFDLSYAALKPDAQRLFRLLGLLSGPDVTCRSAAALTGRPQSETKRLLDRLAAAHLIDQHAAGRYAFHDLLRLYASERALAEERGSDREAALGRLTEHYLNSTAAAAELLYPYMLRLPAAQAATTEFDDHGSALAWLDAERANLLATILHAQQNGPRQTAWLLADALRGYFYLRREFLDWFSVARAALAAAEAEHEPQAQAAAHFSLGLAHYGRNEYVQANDHYTAALSLCRETGWLLGQAAVYTNLGLIDECRGQLELAASRHTEALALDQRAGARHSEAAALINLGAIDEKRGQLANADDRFTQALVISRELDSRHGEADALYYLGSVAHLRGELDHALDLCTRTLAIYREIGARNDEAQTLTQLANIHRDAGRHPESLAQAKTAVALAAETDDQHAETGARAAQAATLHALGEYHQAAEWYQQALSLALKIDAHYEECQVLILSTANQLRLGRHEEAITYARHAVGMARDRGYRLLEGQALTSIADAYQSQGQQDQAVMHARQALAVHLESGHRLGHARTLEILGLPVH